MNLCRIGPCTLTYLFLFFYSFHIVSALDNQSIILQIQSGNVSYCRPIGGDEGPLGTLDLRKVPQFGAMCNIPPPDAEQLKFLLENNVIPVLCMGIYDVLQRFCKSAVGIFPMREKFPLTVDGTIKLFNSFDESDKFSSLHTFCTITVKNNTIPQSASLDAEVSPWWNQLNVHMRSENKCVDICRTNEKDKVNPLCSYIIWFNSLYLSFEKAKEIRPSPKLEETDENQEIPSKQTSFIEIPQESNQIWASVTQNQSTLSSTVSTMVSTSTTLEKSGQIVSQEHFPNLEANRTDKLLVIAPSSSSQQTTLFNEKIQESYISKTMPTKTPQGVTLDAKTKTGSDISQGSAVHIEQAGTFKETEPKLKADSEISPSKLAELVNINVNTEDGYSTPIVTKPVDGTKKTSGKSKDGMVEADLAQEITPEGVEMEQPSLADKDIQLPYSDEELENGDGDDIDFEPEGSAKLAQNKTILNNSKSSSVDQGINDSDKAYGEEREILIEDHFIEAEDSHFFTYFLCTAVLTILVYLAFHNKKKILALALEGKRTRSTRRRPNSSNYSKLDCSLEEAMASSHTPASVTHVLY